MFTPKAHIIIIDGKPGCGINTLCFELALILLYNAQKTALVLSPDSPLRNIIKKRLIILPKLLSPDIIDEQNFYEQANNYSAVIIPHTKSDDDLALYASTYITLIESNKRNIQDFSKSLNYINSLFELKKKIAATYGRSLNWIVCENNPDYKIITTPNQTLEKISHTYGFKITPPLNRRLAYKNNFSGISAQDKSLPILKKELTYDDICAKREITKLAEFIFN